MSEILKNVSIDQPGVRERLEELRQTIHTAYTNLPGYKALDTTADYFNAQAECSYDSHNRSVTSVQVRYNQPLVSHIPVVFYVGTFHSWRREDPDASSAGEINTVYRLRLKKRGGEANVLCEELSETHTSGQRSLPWLDATSLEQKSTKLHYLEDMTQLENSLTGALARIVLQHP